MRKLSIYFLTGFLFLFLFFIESSPTHAITITYTCDTFNTPGGKNAFSPAYNGNSFCSTGYDCPANTTKVNSPPCVKHGDMSTTTFTCDALNSSGGRNAFSPADANGNSSCATGYDCPAGNTKVGAPPCVKSGNTSTTTFTCDSFNSPGGRNSFSPTYNGNSSCATGYDCPAGNTKVGAPPCVKHGDMSTTTFTCDALNTTGGRNAFSPADANGNSSCATGYDCPAGNTKVGSAPCVKHGDMSTTTFTCDSFNSPGGRNSFSPPDANGNSYCANGYDCPANATNKGSPPCVAGTTVVAAPPPPCAGAIKSSGGCSSVNTALGSWNTDPAGFVRSLFGYLLSISGGIAVLIIMFAGYKMMMSKGDPEKIAGAREQLTAAIIGLLFLIFSLVILQVIGVDILHLPGFK